AKRCRRARQRELAVFIDETHDAIAGAAKPKIGAAQQPIELAVGSHRRLNIQRHAPPVKTTVRSCLCRPPDLVATKSPPPVSCSIYYHVAPASAIPFAGNEKRKKPAYQRSTYCKQSRIRRLPRWLERS